MQWSMCTVNALYRRSLYRKGWSLPLPLKLHLQSQVDIWQKINIDVVHIVSNFFFIDKKTAKGENKDHLPSIT